MGVSGAVVGGFIIPYSIKLSIFIIDMNDQTILQRSFKR